MATLRQEHVSSPGPSPPLFTLHEVVRSKRISVDLAPNNGLEGQDKMDRLKACEECLYLSASLLRWEVALAQGSIGQYVGQADIFLGTSVDLHGRAESGCESCRSIMGTGNHADLERDFGKVYGVSAHLLTKQPTVWIIWGNTGSHNENPVHRRSQLINLRMGMFMSTNLIFANTAIGRGRHYDLESYNIGLIRRWIEQCDKHHKSTCWGHRSNLPLPKAPLSFIDVEDLCIVTPEEHVRYAALSYVWGGAVAPLAKKANMPLLRIPGAFMSGASLELPATIRDAIRLCGRLGIRHLWVDSLCIVQDDMESKMQQIRAMGSTFAGAYLTLVALSSEDANSRIPRVSPDGTASTPSPFVHLPGQTLVQASFGARGLPPMIHAESTWRHRAWTLQETILSKRLLCLGSLASWVCSGAEWSEDFQTLSETADGEDAASTTEGRAKLSLPDWPDIAQYYRLAARYAGRRLTMPEDTLNAFEGVLAPMREHFGSEFLFGIPEFFFDVGLLWQYRRRGGRPRTGSGWAGQKHEFPSWSWISFEGSHLQTFHRADYLYPRPGLVVSPLVKWRKQNKATDEWEDVDNSYHVVRKHFENPDAVTPDNWTKHVNESEPPYYQCSSYSHIHPCPKFSYPIPTHKRSPNLGKVSYYPHLLFRGSLARVRFQFQDTEEERAVMNGKLQTRALVPERDLVNTVDGAWIGRVRLDLQPGSRVPDSDEQQEVIAISEAKIALSDARDHWLTTEAKDREEITRNPPWYQFVNVLWIGRTENDKIYRKALGRIWLEAWEKLTVEQVSILLT